MKIKRVKIPTIEEAMPQSEERIVPSIPPRKILPVCCTPARIAETSERMPRETIGEKSILPIRKKPILEKRLIYGSQIAVIKCPNLVNLAPGNQDIRI